MRTQRRDFAVEYKTSRRPSKGEAKSIWGNLDLRAMADSVEADGTLPPDDRKPATVCVSEPSDLTLATSAQVGSQAPTEVIDASHSVARSPVLTVSLANDEVQRLDTQASEHDTAGQQPAPEVGVKRPMRRTKPSVPRPAVDDWTGEAGSDGELAYLEEQNRSLKRLLIDKLRKENAYLTSRLRRFHRS